MPKSTTRGRGKHDVAGLMSCGPRLGEGKERPALDGDLHRLLDQPLGVAQARRQAAPDVLDTR
jgi:hypothetical protein